MIQYTISNVYIKLKLNERSRGWKTELHHKVLLRVSVHELHIYMLKKDATEFSMSYDEKVLVQINDSSPWLISPPQLLNMTYNNQIICGYKTCVQAGTYQEYLNHWLKRRMILIKDCEKQFMSVSYEQLNEENIETRQSEVV